MNTKLVRYVTLVMTLCLMSSLASAQGLKVRAVSKGKVSPKIHLPNIGITLDLLHRGPIETITTSVKDFVSQVTLGEKFDEEMDTLAANIAEALKEEDMTGEQTPFGTFNPTTDLQKQIERQAIQARQNMQISAGTDGTVLSRKAGLREIHFPGARLETDQNLDSDDLYAQIQLHHTFAQAEELVDHLDGLRERLLLEHSMPAEILQLDPIAKDYLQLAIRVYELMARDQFAMNSGKTKNPITWDLDLAIQNATDKVLRKVYVPSPLYGQLSSRYDTPLGGTQVVYEPYGIDIAREKYGIFFSPETDVPGFIDAIQAVSFTEYMVKENDFNFPFFGKDPSLNYKIVRLWSKLWNNELSPEIGQFLLKDYMYARNARDIGAVMDTAYEDFLLKHKFPGLNFGAKPEILKIVCENVEKDILTLTSDELLEMQLGMEVTLLVRTLPSSPFWQELDEITRRKVDTMRNLLEGGLENGALQN